MIFKDAEEVFKDAIAEGRLSEDQDSEAYAGRYMYMGTNGGGKDLFKNIFTRDYLP